MVVLSGRHAAPHADRRQKLLGKSPSVALASREASQMENAGLENVDPIFYGEVKQAAFKALGLN